MGSDKSTLLSFLRGTNTGGSSITGRVFFFPKSPNRLCSPPSLLLNAKRRALSRESSYICLRGVHRESFTITKNIVFLWAQQPPRGKGASLFKRFLDHTQRSNTVGRNPLDEWSAHRTDLYLTKHNTHNRQTSMPLVGFEPKISAGERSQIYALDGAATGISVSIKCRK